MKRTSNGWTLWMALIAFLALGAYAPASGQDQAGDRITILVPNLAPREGANNRFGENVAKELRQMIADLHTHQTVSEKELNDARKRFGLSEQDLFDCVRARQLAMQQNWGLVLCGEYTSAGDRQVNVAAQFVGAQDGATFEVEPFSASERDAKQAAQQILQTFNQFTNQLRRLVFCQQYIDSEQWDSALENCEEALEINPSSESALYKHGYIMWKLQRHDEALQSLDRVLEIDPIDQDALKLAGIVATEQGNRDVAMEYLERYMELNPNDVQVRLTVATDISNAGDYAGALRFAEAGLEVEPDNLNLLTYIGHFAVNAASNAETNGGDPAEVTEYYQKAADAYQQVFEERGDSTDVQIVERMVIALSKIGDTQRAVTMGRQATQAHPEEAKLWEAYARALQDAGQPGEAIAAIERAESLGAAGPGLTQRKALLQLDQGQESRAIAALQQGVQQGHFSASDAFNTIFAHAYQNKFQKGQMDAAFNLLEAAGPLAVAQNDKLTRNFWRGYILFQQAQQVHAPMTAESARRAKPMFERALELFQAARGYEQIHASADVPKLIENTQRFIEIEDALIRRGR